MTLRTRNNILSAQDYNPFGEEIRNYSRRDKLSGGTDDKYKFTGKERDKESGLDYFGARYYDSEVGRWLSVDPLGSQRPGLSPYQYCQNNPLALIDPTGMLDEVIAKDEESKELINKSLKPEDAKFVKYDKDGKIDKDELNKCNSDDGNLDALKTLVNSDNTYEVATTKDGFNEISSDGSTKFCHWYGQVDAVGGHGGEVLPPNTSSPPNSVNNTFQVYINKNNVSNIFTNSKGYYLAHELYGHAYLNSKGAKWEHDFQKSKNGPVDANRELYNTILQRQKNSERNLLLWQK